MSGSSILRRELAIFIVVGMMLSISLMVIGVAGTTSVSDRLDERDLASRSAPSISSTIIRIGSNSEMSALVEARGWQGHGTLSDPYVIQGIDMAIPDDTTAITIGNTSLNFILRDCRFLYIAPQYVGSAITFQNVSNATLENVTISNNFYAFAMSDCDNITIRNCATDNVFYGVYIESCRKIVIENNSFDLSYFYGVHLGSSIDILVQFNSFGNESLGGIELMYSDQNIVRSNTVQNSYGNGINLMGSCDNLIINNVLESSEIYLWEFSDRNLVQWNSMQGEFSAIEVYYSSNNNSFIENTILDGLGIYVTQSADDLFRGNVLVNPYWGFYVSTSNRLVLEGNQLTNGSVLLDWSFESFTTQTIYPNNTVNGGPIYYYKNGNMGNASVPLDAGQVILGNVSFLTVSGLHLRDQGFGIVAGYCTDIMMEENEIANASSDGIFTTFCERVVAKANVISGGGTGIAIDSSQNMTLTGNHLVYPRSYGIYISSCLDSILYDNQLLGCSITIGGSWWGLDPGQDKFVLGRQTIPTNNTVNGKPVRFLKDIDMGGASLPIDAGEIILVGVKDLVIEGQDLRDANDGLEGFFCQHIIVRNNTFTNLSFSDIVMDDTTDSLIQDNVFTNHNIGYTYYGGGISLAGRPIGGQMSCHDNIVRRNLFKNSSGIGIVGYSNSVEDNRLFGGEGISTAGSDNAVSENTLDNSGGISTTDGGHWSSMVYNDNQIRGNRIVNCSQGGIRIEGASRTIVRDNVVADASIGILIKKGSYAPSNSNVLANNTLWNCCVEIRGDRQTYTSQSISNDTTVNGRPVIYYSNIDLLNHSVPLKVPANAGQVILANVRNAEVGGVDLEALSIGLEIAYSTNVIVESCSFSNCTNKGVDMLFSNDCVLRDDLFRNCSIGIGAVTCVRNTFERQSIKGESYGIYLASGSDFNVINGNSLLDGRGVFIDTSSSNSVQGNTVVASNGTGIMIFYSQSNQIMGNNISGSASYAIMLSSSINNTIERNILVDNNGCGSAFSQQHAQAFDDGLNRWNSTMGNYWSDWLSPDADHDGIVDMPYEMAGNGLTRDSRPLASLVGVPHGLTVRTGTLYADLRWTGVNYTLVGPVTGFTITRSAVTGGQVTFEVSPGAREFSDTSIAKDTIYQYTIVAKAGGYRSGPSGPVTASVPAEQPVPSVQIISPISPCLVNRSSVNVIWNGTDEISGIAYYHVRLNLGEWLNASTNLSMTLEGLEEGANSIAVKAFNHAGNSAMATVNLTVDTIAPVIVSHSPMGGDVPTDVVAEVTFSEAMNTSTLSFEVPGAGGMVAWSGNKAIFTPSSHLVSGTQYTASVSGEDPAGNHVAYTWTFDTQAQGSGTPGFDWWWLLLLLVIVIVVVVIYYLDRRRRRKGRENK